MRLDVARRMNRALGVLTIAGCLAFAGWLTGASGPRHSSVTDQQRLDIVTAVRGGLLIPEAHGAVHLSGALARGVPDGVAYAFPRPGGRLLVFVPTYHCSGETRGYAWVGPLRDTNAMEARRLAAHQRAPVVPVEGTMVEPRWSIVLTGGWHYVSARGA